VHELRKFIVESKQVLEKPCRVSGAAASQTCAELLGLALAVPTGLSDWAVVSCWFHSCALISQTAAATFDVGHAAEFEFP